MASQPRLEKKNLLQNPSVSKNVDIHPVISDNNRAHISEPLTMVLSLQRITFVGDNLNSKEMSNWFFSKHAVLLHLHFSLSYSACAEVRKKSSMSQNLSDCI